MKFTLIAVAVIAAFSLAALPGCETPGLRGELRGQLEELQTEREYLADDLAATRDELASIRDAAETAEGPAAAQLATVAANLEARVAEGLGVLERMDGAMESVETRLAELPAYDDPLSETAGTLSAVAEGAAPWVPSPFGEILGLVGVIGGSFVAARERRRRKGVEQDRDNTQEAIRDINAGFDRWFEQEITNGGKDEALRAREAIRGRLSDRTRPVVARAADHPLGVAA